MVEPKNCIFKMVVGFIWNSRGLNRPDKLLRTGDLIRDNHPDFICLSETKKDLFTTDQLLVLDKHDVFIWNWLPAIGTAGGILVGINSEIFSVVSWSILNNCVSCIIKNKKDAIVWRLISVYGPAYEDLKLDFINELHSALSDWSGPTLVGGDFNLVRDRSEKNSGNINLHWSNLFNDWINCFGLMELKNAGRRYTWSNNQVNAIMATLD